MSSYMDHLRALREDNDLTQAQIAEVLGTSQTMYARYEREANELPIRHFVTLCRYYKVSADYILGLNEGRQNRDATQPMVVCGQPPWLCSYPND